MRIRNLFELAAGLGLLLCALHWCYAVGITLVRGRARKCPRCNGRTRWSRVQIYDRLLPAFVAPRRCESCQGRFYAAHSVNYAERARVAAATRAAVSRAAAQARPARAGALVGAAAQGNAR